MKYLIYNEVFFGLGPVIEEANLTSEKAEKLKNSFSGDEYTWFYKCSHEEFLKRFKGNEIAMDWYNKKVNAAFA